MAPITMNTLSAAAVVLTGASAVVVKPTTRLGKAMASVESSYKDNWKCQSWDATSGDSQNGSKYVIETLYGEDDIQDKCKAFAPSVIGDELSPEQIAEAWKQAGMSADACPAALVIVSGEAQTNGAGTAYSIKNTGPSGMLQCDFCRGALSNDIQNLDGVTTGSCGAKAPQTAAKGEYCETDAVVGVWNPDPSKVIKAKKATYCKAKTGYENRCTLNANSGTCSACTAKDIEHCDKDGFMGKDCQLDIKNPCIGLWGGVRTVAFPALSLNPAVGMYSAGCNDVRNPTAAEKREPVRGSSSLYKGSANLDKCLAAGADTCSAASPSTCVCKEFETLYADSDITQFEKDEMDCNFVGPFCHWQYGNGAMQTGPAWNGGNFQQDLPFPQYYFDKYITLQEKPKGNDGNDGNKVGSAKVFLQSENGVKDWNVKSKDVASNLPEWTRRVWDNAQTVCNNVFGGSPTPAKSTSTTTTPAVKPHEKTTSTTTTPAPHKKTTSTTTTPSPKPHPETTSTTSTTTTSDSGNTHSCGECSNFIDPNTGAPKPCLLPNGVCYSGGNFDTKATCTAYHNAKWCGN